MAPETIEPKRKGYSVLPSPDEAPHLYQQEELDGPVAPVFEREKIAALLPPKGGERPAPSLSTDLDRELFPIPRAKLLAALSGGRTSAFVGKAEVGVHAVKTHPHFFTDPRVSPQRATDGTAVAIQGTYDRIFRLYDIKSGTQLD